MDWRTSSFSFSNGQCIEVASGQAMIAVRDTKQQDIGYPDVLTFDGVTWGKFIRQIKDGNTWG
jgi:hypothetical protein